MDLRSRMLKRGLSDCGAVVKGDAGADDVLAGAATRFDVLGGITDYCRPRAELRMSIGGGRAVLSLQQRQYQKVVAVRHYYLRSKSGLTLGSPCSPSTKGHGRELSS